jgi:CBS domain-containing protein
MEVTGALSAILASKGTHVWSIPPDGTVFEALQLMADRKVGALAVVDHGDVVGIFSERDYARKIILHGKSSKDTDVAEVMTQPVTAESGMSIDDCMRLMTGERARHVLVIDGGELTGIISLGDLVNWTIAAQRNAIGQLSSYISGSCSTEGAS